MTIIIQMMAGSQLFWHIQGHLSVPLLKPPLFVYISSSVEA